MKRAWMIIDGQWGSTGKGLLAGYLGENWRPDGVVCNFGPNAGHTFVDKNGKATMTQMLPTAGVTSRHVKKIFIGPGAVINPDILKAELKEFKDGLKGKEIYIHERACIVYPWHCKVETGKLTRISSTCKGTGEAQTDKIMRKESAIAGNLNRFGGLKPYIANHQTFLHEIATCNHLQIESAQGLELGINSGSHYPHCTSRDINTFQVLSECGVPAGVFSVEVYLSIRCHPIRVGNAYDANGDRIGYSGDVYPDMKELTWEHLGQTAEKTTVTGKVRRVFTFSMESLRKSALQLNPTGIFLNFTNYLDQQPYFDHGATGSLVESIEREYRMTRDKYGLNWHAPIVLWIGTGPRIDQVIARPETGDLIE